MSKDTINIGVIGLGTIGSGVVTILTESQENLSKRAAKQVKLLKAADRDTSRLKEVTGLTDEQFTDNADDIINDPEIDIVVEVIGGVNPARQFIEQSLKNGKHVVTSNKEVIAKHGQEFIQLANENNVNVYYEAAVGGGIPIIQGIKNCLSANDTKEVFGIMNGTTNYILSKMYAEGADFDAVLKEAQDLGFAEADPTSDVDGYDVAYKLAILGSIAFNTHFKYEDIYFEGIRNISADDIKIAKSLGYVIKLVAIGVAHEDERVELRVHPAMIEENHPLANVNGSFNAVFVKGNYVDDTMFYGHGAGELPTASAVVGDIMDIAMQSELKSSHPSMNTNFTEKKVVPIGEVTSEYCFSLQVKDETGVLAAVTRACSDAGVSIESIQQKKPEDGLAELIIITHEVKESAMQEALETIKGNDSVVSLNSFIRVGL